MPSTSTVVQNRVFGLEQTDGIAFSGRENLWPGVIDAIRAEPYVGAGLGRSDILTLRLDGVHRNPHNEFLRLGYEVGIVATSCLLLGLVLLQVDIRRRWRSTSDTAGLSGRSAAMWRSRAPRRAALLHDVRQRAAVSRHPRSHRYDVGLHLRPRSSGGARSNGICRLMPELAFLTYCSRSGSTKLATMIDTSGADIIVVPEFRSSMLAFRFGADHRLSHQELAKLTRSDAQLRTSLRLEGRRSIESSLPASLRRPVRTCETSSTNTWPGTRRRWSW
ncbi:MAG: O-antigen ligase family protein [Acidimicrobiales bacterium]